MPILLKPNGLYLTTISSAESKPNCSAKYAGMYTYSENECLSLVASMSEQRRPARMAKHSHFLRKNFLMVLQK